MRSLISGLAALGILAAFAIVSIVGGPAAGYLGAQSALPAPAPMKIAIEEKNPWTNLNLNANPRQFQFVVVTDRTGGHRPGVFAEAVKKINLLQPEFVISVGDLIEGYSEDRAQWALEWAEFEGKTRQLEMPFFYVPGNHDLSSQGMSDDWKRKFGRKYYDFRYHDVLFVALNSEDPPKSEPFKFSSEQQAWFADVMERNRDARWTFVFMHKPAWTYPDDDHNATGWNAIERALGDRKYTVFAGHKHNYVRTVRNGRDYIMLATTGGSSKLRGKADGEFDHVVWVTMKDGDPVIANIMLDGIDDKTLRTQPEPRPTGKKKKAE